MAKKRLCNSGEIRRLEQEKSKRSKNSSETVRRYNRFSGGAVRKLLLFKNINRNTQRFVVSIRVWKVWTTSVERGHLGRKSEPKVRDHWRGNEFGFRHCS